NQYPVMDGTTVNHGVVANRHVVTNFGRPPLVHHVDAGIILHIAAFSNLDPVYIAASCSIKPHAALLAEGYIPDNISAWSDKNGVVVLGFAVEKFVNHRSSGLSFLIQMFLNGLFKFFVGFGKRIQLFTLNKKGRGRVYALVDSLLALLHHNF